MSKVNFLPEDYLDKKAQQRTNIICLALFLLVMGGVACGFLIAEKRQRAIDRRAKEINQKMIEANQALQKLDQLQNRKKQMMSKASICASLMEPVPRSLLLATQTNSLPMRVSLVKYKLVCKEIKKPVVKSKTLNKKAKYLAAAQGADKKEEEKPAEPEVPKLDTKIEIAGIAPTDIQVAKYIESLNQSELFSQVNLVLSEEKEIKEELLRHFKLMIQLDPEAQAKEEDVLLARKKTITGM
jgi:Tfp pilus assembly protein PilN